MKRKHVSPAEEAEAKRVRPDEAEVRECVRRWASHWRALDVHCARAYEAFVAEQKERGTHWAQRLFYKRRTDDLVRWLYTGDLPHDRVPEALRRAGGLDPEQSARVARIYRHTAESYHHADRAKHYRARIHALTGVWLNCDVYYMDERDVEAIVAFVRGACKSI